MTVTAPPAGQQSAAAAAAADKQANPNLLDKLKAMQNALVTHRNVIKYHQKGTSRKFPVDFYVSPDLTTIHIGDKTQKASELKDVTIGRKAPGFLAWDAAVSFRSFAGAHVCEMDFAAHDRIRTVGARKTTRSR